MTKWNWKWTYRQARISLRRVGNQDYPWTCQVAKVQRVPSPLWEAACQIAWGEMRDRL